MFLYRLTNTTTGAAYIGITTGSVGKRFREHKCAANCGSPKPLYRAMRKYGVSAFSVDVLGEYADLEDLRAAEAVEIIRQSTLTHGGTGYNLQPGGQGIGRCAPKGEAVRTAKLTSEAVAYIRAADNADKPNRVLVSNLQELFGIAASQETIKAARNGKTWRHLNAAYPPVKVSKGARVLPVSDLARERQLAALDVGRSQAVRTSADLRRGKRGANATLSTDIVRQIFHAPTSLSKTAVQFGVSKKMVLLIKQRKAHTYLTKEL